MLRPRWRITGTTFELRLAAWNDADRPTALLSVEEALRSLDTVAAAMPSWSLNARELAACARHLRQRHGFARPFRATSDVGVVREALSKGLLVAWREAVSAVSAPVPGPLDTDAQTLDALSTHKEKTWIEIELLDMEGAPVPFERYWIKLPDGTVREGALDAKGRAYFGDLDPGSAEIRWPDRDGDATLEERPLGQRSLSQTTTEEESIGNRTWIEIELLDMEGAPVPYERYWIKLPDGTVREGSLDENGRAYFQDLDPGSCIIRWPHRDDEATLLDLDPTTGHPDSDVAGQVQTLLDAAEDGTPFCEECERARAAAAHG